MNFEKPESKFEKTRLNVGDVVRIPTKYVDKRMKRRESNGSLVPQRAEDWRIMWVELAPQYGEKPFAVVIEDTGLHVATSYHIPLDELEKANP